MKHEQKDCVLHKYNKSVQQLRPRPVGQGGECQTQLTYCTSRVQELL